jgi:LacI family transcriptional regulator
VTGNGRPRATMRDVAALAGVSLKSVSRVVNNEPVTEPVRVKVLRAVEQLDYRHNFAASDLRRKVGQARVIGVLMQDLANDFSSGLLRALEDACRERGLAVLASSLDEEPDRERLLVGDLISRRVNGLVIMPASQRQDYLDVERRAGLPTVFVDRQPRGIDADSVTVDNLQGAYDAAQHLITRGHRRIAVLSDLATIQTATLRIQGVAKALAGSGISLDVELVRTGLRTAEAARDEVTTMLEGPNPPTGVVALRNILSIGALQAVRATGHDDAVAVIGFDDFSTADLINLTVVRQDVPRIGRSAAELLFARLDGDDAPPRHVTVPHSIIERGSGEVAPRR